MLLSDQISLFQQNKLLENIRSEENEANQEEASKFKRVEEHKQLMEEEKKKKEQEEAEKKRQEEEERQRK